LLGATDRPTDRPTDRVAKPRGIGIYLVSGDVGGGQK
ncbi:hypothetical protein THAOC_25647, partial [Thalassiosira oceanica]